jgi:hypothetical protein
LNGIEVLPKEEHLLKYSKKQFVGFIESRLFQFLTKYCPIGEELGQEVKSSKLGLGIMLIF